MDTTGAHDVKTMVEDKMDTKDIKESGKTKSIRDKYVKRTLKQMKLNGKIVVNSKMNDEEIVGRGCLDDIDGSHKYITEDTIRPEYKMRCQDELIKLKSHAD